MRNFMIVMVGCGVLVLASCSRENTGEIEKLRKDLEVARAEIAAAKAEVTTAKVELAEMKAAKKKYSAINRDTFKQIQNGMRYREVETLLGESGRHLDPVPGSPLEVYRWGADIADPTGPSITVHFENGKAFTKESRNFTE